MRIPGLEQVCGRARRFSFRRIVHHSLKEVTTQPIRLSIGTRFMHTGYLANLYFSGGLAH